MTERAERCYYWIEGPKYERKRVVLWRKQCKNLTRHPSGLCWQHRGSERG